MISLKQIYGDRRFFVGDELNQIRNAERIVEGQISDSCKVINLEFAVTKKGVVDFIDIHGLQSENNHH